MLHSADLPARRSFLIAAAAGTAALGAAVTGPGLGTADPHGLGAAAPLPDGVENAIMAYVQDVRSGSVAILVEGREVVVTDHALVSHLAHTVARAS